MFNRLTPSKVEYAEAFGLSSVFLSACDAHQEDEQHQDGPRNSSEDELMSQFVDSICDEPEVETISISDELSCDTFTIEQDLKAKMALMYGQDMCILSQHIMQTI